MILDTSFLIDVMNADDAALGKVDEIEGDGIEQNVPAMTLLMAGSGSGASGSTSATPPSARRVSSVTNQS